jgi:threonyl-tRNA synthetase
MAICKITLPDGTVKEYEAGVSGYEIAKSISGGLAREALAIEVNGQVWDLSRQIHADARVRILKWNDEGGKYAFWHSSAHLMAEAVEALFPGTKFGIGPPIDEGFYYDLDLGGHTLSTEDLERIEAKMVQLSQRDVPYERKEVAWEDAVSYFTDKGDAYKLELLQDLKGQQISMYHHGEFTDLCYGPHLPSTGKIKAIKLLSVAGAYWRGNEKNKMLQRIYGVTFPTPKELDEYLVRLEEAKKRDHRKLGRELELFVFHDIAPGAPFWLPNGMIIFRELEKFLRAELDKQFYQEISTPILVKKDLWERSGHWDHYKENMFYFDHEETVFGLKPMNCPESTYAYKHKIRSYKDLPIRLSEIGRLHRNELSGALGGMFRVRQITMDDAHIYCRPDQIESEINLLLGLVKSFYAIFSLKPSFNFSTKPDGAMGDPALWDQAEGSLRQVLESNGLEYRIKEKDGAFYGPKIDIQIEDAIGRSWQVATIQLDFVGLPERFDLEYIAEDGSRKRPVVIHRAIFGSFERFIGILTEHFAGAFPVWLAPIQVAVLPITDDQVDFASSVADRLRTAFVRVELDDRREKIGYKIRDWETRKVPYMLVVGNKEKEASTVAVRQHKKGDLGALAIDEFIARVRHEIDSKTVTS